MASLEGGERLLVYMKARTRELSTKRVAAAGFFDQETATNANLQEYGAPEANIPPRPFMQMTAEENRELWASHVQSQLAEGKTANEALKSVGLLMAKAIGLNIKSGWKWQANAKSTVRRKGFNRPLVETGRMFTMVRFKVGVPGEGGED